MSQAIADQEVIKATATDARTSRCTNATLIERCMDEDSSSYLILMHAPSHDSLFPFSFSFATVSQLGTLQCLAGMTQQKRATPFVLIRLLNPGQTHGARDLPPKAESSSTANVNNQPEPDINTFPNHGFCRPGFNLTSMKNSR